MSEAAEIRQSMRDSKNQTECETAKITECERLQRSDRVSLRETAEIRQYVSEAAEIEQRSKGVLV